MLIKCSCSHCAHRKTKNKMYSSSTSWYLWAACHFRSRFLWKCSKPQNILSSGGIMLNISKWGHLTVSQSPIHQHSWFCGDMHTQQPDNMAQNSWRLRLAVCAEMTLPSRPAKTGCSGTTVWWRITYPSDCWSYWESCSQVLAKKRLCSSLIIWLSFFCLSFIQSTASFVKNNNLLSMRDLPTTKWIFSHKVKTVNSYSDHKP